jgi:hypothetical protein
MAKMMQGMMAPKGSPGGAASGCCGMGGTKPYYASLMESPVLTDEARRAVKAQALERLNSGMVALSAQQLRVHHAMAMDDFAAAKWPSTGSSARRRLQETSR